MFFSLTCINTLYYNNGDDTFVSAIFWIITGFVTLTSILAMFVNGPHLIKKIFFLTLHEYRLYFVKVRKGVFTSAIAFEVGWTCKRQLVFYTDIQYNSFFFYLPKSVFLGILWVAVGGSSIGVSGLQDSCSRYAELLTGACNSINIFHLLLILLFFIKIR